jgi:hypothetical protein
MIIVHNLKMNDGMLMVLHLMHTTIEAKWKEEHLTTLYLVR